MPSSNDDSAVLNGKRIIIALTGGIACYKIATLVSRLKQASATVNVLMTDAATHFITPLTFQTLSANPVHTSLWQTESSFDPQHINLAQSADIMVIAPASANTIAKLAHGLCDNIVTTVATALPQKTPLLLVPAMNTDMWLNPITQKNIKTLQALPNCHTLGPEVGYQACGTTGPGRMSEPDSILNEIINLLA